jgi:hypothetical protein
VLPQYRRAFGPAFPLWSAGRRLTIVIVASSDLSPAERSLWDAFPRGAWFDLRPKTAEGGIAGASAPADEHIIRAEIIASLLMGAHKPALGFQPAIRLRGARIIGRLDLMGATLTCALVCEYCRFDDPIRFVEATTKTVRIVDSQIPGFNGARMRADGIVNFHHSVIATVLRLDGAKISGELCVDHATIGSSPGEVVLAAENLVVDGPANCRGVVTYGAVSLRGAQVSGTIDTIAAQITSVRRVALDANFATIGGRFRGNQMVVEGETRLRHARIGGSLDLVGAQLRNPAGSALGCGGLTIEGGVWCSNGFEADGELRFIGARLGGNLTLAGARLSKPGGVALNLDRAALADLDCTGLAVSEGEISLVNTKIASQFGLADAQLHAPPGRPALVMDGCVIGGELSLTRLRAIGEVSLQTSHIGGRLHMVEASIENPGGTALQILRTEIGADLFCDRMTIIGVMTLAGSRISGHAKLEHFTLANEDGTALDAEALQAAELSLLPAEPVRGTVILSHAQLGVLRDDPASWPARMHLDGLTYNILDPQLPSRQRLIWLARDSTEHQLQPYEQLAILYGKIGQMAEARRVLYAKERYDRATKTALGRLWSSLQDITIGYGYKPWRAAAWFVLLLALGSAIFAFKPYPSHISGAPPFDPVIYTLDLLLPIISLGQKNSFNPTGFEQWLAYLLVIAGWLLASTIATAIARVVRRQ